MLSWLQVCGYLQVLLTSINGPVVLEAASGILSLAKVADRVLAAAPVLAIGALMDLWDHDSSSASHSQIMNIVCANLDALQVSGIPGRLPAKHLLLRRVSAYGALFTGLVLEGLSVRSQLQVP